MARSFNGSSDFITSGHAYGPTAYTFSGRFYVTSLANAYTGLMGDFNTVSFYVKSTGKLALFMSSGAYDGTGANTLIVNTWYNLAFTGSNSVSVNAYVNGIFDNTTGTGANITGATTFDIGHDINSGRFLSGRCADVSIWSAILTAGEITSLASGMRPSSIRSQSLIANWPIDGLQSPEPDLSGNAHNGTLTGTAFAAGPPIASLTPRWPQFLVPPAAFLPSWATASKGVVIGAGVV